MDDEKVLIVLSMRKPKKVIVSVSHIRRSMQEEG